MDSFTAAASFAQLHSHDHRVRMRAAALFSIVFEHVCTMQDFSVLDEALCEYGAAYSAGVTEWQGRSAGRLVSVGWDWLGLHDGALVADGTVPPRSNIMLIDGQGYDMSQEECDAALLQLIRVIPWQARAAAALREEQSCDWS